MAATRIYPQDYLDTIKYSKFYITLCILQWPHFWLIELSWTSRCAAGGRPLDTRRISPTGDRFGHVHRWVNWNLARSIEATNPNKSMIRLFKMNLNNSHNQRLIYSFQSMFMEVIKSSLPLASNTPSTGPSATSRNFSVQSSPGFDLRSSYQSWKLLEQEWGAFHYMQD
jgi:hypothetical protein